MGLIDSYLNALARAAGGEWKHSGGSDGFQHWEAFWRPNLYVLVSETDVEAWWGGRRWKWTVWDMSQFGRSWSSTIGPHPLGRLKTYSSGSLARFAVVCWWAFRYGGQTDDND